MNDFLHHLSPTQLSEMYGQKELIGEGKILWQMDQTKEYQSFVLSGPPGCGKTTLATVLAKNSELPSRYFNAAIEGKKELAQKIEDLSLFTKGILIIDEIHRLTKNTKDYLLPFLEQDKIIIFGLTTEPPAQRLNPAVRSRLYLFNLVPLSLKEMQVALQQAIQKWETPIQVEEEVLTTIAHHAQGDLRMAYQELGLLLQNQQTSSLITLKDLQALPLQHPHHQTGTSEYYALISALQKSIRGSDVDAAMHYFVQLMNLGELEGVCRRLLVIAYEDIGLANPGAAARTVAAVQAAKELGLPEAKIPLANVIIDLSLSPKSNSPLEALQRAEENIAKGNVGTIPKALQDRHVGKSSSYVSPHHGPVPKTQHYYPDGIPYTPYYQPKETGKYERALKQQWINQQKNR